LSRSFQFEQERLDIFIIFVVVGVYGAVAYDVRCCGDIAARRCFVLESKAYSVKIRGSTGEVKQWVEMVALGVVLGLEWYLLLRAR
jgi:hypothetical protein